MDSIRRYFPGLSGRQIEQFAALEALYADWNAKINVISRKDIGNLYPNHVLHSLAIAKFFGPLAESTSMLDIGTGGGFPGIPLAIFYPQCRFHLIDRIGKKIRVASAVAEAIGLENVTLQHGDIAECRDKYDYVVSRAVMPLNDLVGLVRKNIDKGAEKGNKYRPGLVCLKGGDLAEESKGIRQQIVEIPLPELMPEEHFMEKSLVYVPF
ncbi:MAG: 16S rRNA (guanine(527)-N(7))-methyltransferase RsmG [Clostridium sp.]|nr:16S rRNA (guanine(527)-N(7))-methyltransferase RsmG [Clostridium sp.]